MSTKIKAGQLDLVSTELESAGTDSRQLSIKGGAITEGKLGFSWKVVEMLASAFSYSATRSTFTLGTAASSNANVTDYATLVKNGLDTQSLTTTTAAADDFSLSGATLSVHGDITASGAAYKLRYIIGTESGSTTASGNTMWSATVPQDPLETETDYFTDSTLDPKWTEWDPQAALTVEEDADGLKLTRVADASEFNGLVQDLPAGTRFAVTAEIALDAEGGKVNGAGIIVGEDLVTNPTTDAFWINYVVFDTGGSEWVVNRARYSNYAGANTFGLADPAGIHTSRIFLRIFVDTVAVTVMFLVSRDGERWVSVGPAVSYSGDTLDQVGFVTRNDSGNDLIAYSSMFRVDTTTDPFIPVGAKIGTGGGGGGNVSGYGLYADAPATPAADGDTWTSSDGPVKKVGVAGAWIDMIPGVGEILAMVTGDWTAGGGLVWANTNGSAVVTAGGHAYKAHTSGDIHIFGVMKTPLSANSTSASQTRLVFGSATNEGMDQFMPQDSTGQIRVISWTNWKTSTAPGFPYGTAGSFYGAQMGLGGIFWYRLEDDGVDIRFSIGNGPQGPWVEHYKESRTANLAGGPTEIGVAAGPGTSFFHYAKT
jgi:hypothetical protein